MFSLFSVWLDPDLCMYLYLFWYSILLGVLLSIPFSGVLQINPISVSMTSYAGYNSPTLLGYITIDQLVVMYVKYHLLVLRRTLVTSVSNLRRRDTLEPFSILQILRRRRRSTGVHPYCPYPMMRAAPLGSASSEVSSVRRCYALRRRTQANLVHYCIERYLAQALAYPGVVAVVLPWYCPLSTTHSLGVRLLGGW